MLEKNSNLHLRKIQICFYVKKNSKFASKEDINVFLFKNSDLHLRKIQISLFKNLDLNLRKIQIRLWF